MKRLPRRKNITIIIALMFLMITCTCCTVPGRKVSNMKESGHAKKIMDTFLDSPGTFPVSFSYEGNSYYGFGEGFSEISRDTTDEEDGKHYDVRYSLDGTGLVFRVDAKAYSRYAAYEWTVYITNEGTENSGTVSELLAVDRIYRGSDPVLKGINGDTGDMYAPYSVELKTHDVSKVSRSGRPTHGNFPYFNLEYANGGTFIVLGWPGCWMADFRYSENGTHVTAGQESFEAYLKPGETVRTPLAAFLEYTGRDEAENMNLWREWFIYCNMHRDAEENVIQPVLAYGTVVQGMNSSSIKRIINGYKSHGLSLDYMWLDAGWYVNAKGETCSWPETGTWKVNTKMFPDRFSEISGLMHENGGKTLLWFEPEVVRCNKSEFLASEPGFKEKWMLGTAAAGTWLQGELLDLGDPELRSWLLNRIFTVIDEGGIDMYRQDFNVDPAPVWRSCDDPGRDGITENRYVQGYLAFLDAILERYPAMAAIDSCASGGGRNDLETLRRAVMLHVSDFWDGNGAGFEERQAVAMSLASWIPYFKLEMHENVEMTDYNLRSCIAPWMTLNVSVISRNADWNAAERVCAEWRQISSLCYSDFYPLTEYSKSRAAWRAWEYFDEGRSFGTVSVFRGPDDTENSLVLKLRGLDSAAVYRVHDTSGTFEYTAEGRELMNSGITVTLGAGGSEILFIERQN